MKRASRIFMGFVLTVLAIVAWAIVLGAATDDDRQVELMNQSERYINDGIFIRAMPLLEEAIGLDAGHTHAAEEMLKYVYLNLLDRRGMRRNYIELLERQMGRPDAPVEVFIEAAHFHLETSRLVDALDMIKYGISRTNSEELIALFESNRYAFRLGHLLYEDVTATYRGTIGVMQDGLWGIARSNGTVLIPLQYERVSTFSVDRAIVEQGGEIFAVDRSNNRIALLRSEEAVQDFGNFSHNRFPILRGDNWNRFTGEFGFGIEDFDWLGMHSNGHAAAELDGRWGVIDTAANWVIPAEYDGIIIDELGRSFAQDAVFARSGNSVFLIVNGERVGEAFEDARPFGDEGYAAVMRNGLWGFINTSGEVRIPFQFEDALSFGQHLAAVRVGEYWGYISLNGTVVIEPQFLEAKCFSSGSAPVLTERGWQFITLIEFLEGAGLF